jgi:hypothetical protein
MSHSQRTRLPARALASDASRVGLVAGWQTGSMNKRKKEVLTDGVVTCDHGP